MLSILRNEGDMKIVGGLVGDALDNAGKAITNGIVEGFKIVVGTSAIIIERFSEYAVYVTLIMFFAGKEERLKGKLIKYLAIFGGALYIEKVISLI